MSSLIFCPDCNRKLKVPETMAGKSFRCPGCKAIIASTSLSRSAAKDPEDDEADTPSPSRSIQRAPSARTGSAPSRSRPPREDDSADDIEQEEERPIRDKPLRKKRPKLKKSSTGLIIGLVAAGAVLLLLVVGAGGGLLWYFARHRSQAIPEAEWSTFSPANGNCSVLMPGNPQYQPMTTLGVTVNKYLVTRSDSKFDKAVFIVAFVNLGPDSPPANIMEQFVKAEREHLINTLNGKAGSETPVTLANIPGREFQISLMPRGMLIERAYIAKIGGVHRIYIVATIGDSHSPNHADVTRFFDSFRVDGSAMPPTYLGAAAPKGAAQPPPAGQPPQGNPRPNPPRPNAGRRPPGFPPRRQP